MGRASRPGRSSWAALSTPGETMEPTPSQNRLCVLGPIDLRRPDGTKAGSVLAQPKRVALLTYLRLAGTESVVSRDATLAALWPEVPEERALNALRQGVHFLRRSLGADIVARPADHLLEVPTEALWCDVAEFEAALAQGRTEQALALYRGRFLDGVSIDGAPGLEQWVGTTRTRLQEGAYQAACALSEGAASAVDSASARHFAKRALEIDPLGERGVLALVEAYELAGDVSAAVRAFEAFSHRLRSELGLGPGDALLQRVSAVRRGASPARAMPPGVGVVEVREVPPEPEIVEVRERLATIPLARTPRSAAGYDREEVEPRPGPVVRAGRPLLVAVLASLFVVVAWWQASDVGASSAPVTLRGIEVAARPSVAVLPFTNLSPRRSDEFFVAGVHESVLGALSQVGSIDVSGLAAVRAFARSTLTPAEIAGRLAVSSLVSGSVQRDAGRIRIIVALLDPETGAQLWSETYDRQLDDVFAVQSDIATSVARALHAVLGPKEVAAIERSPTTSIEALDLYMRGRASYLSLSPGGMRDAIDFYSRAIRADSTFAVAWVGLADAYLQQVQFFGYPIGWADTARHLVERAIVLEPELPEAHKTLGFVHSVHGREGAALAASERALAFRPGYADPMNNIGWSSYFLGDLVKAEAFIRRSFRLQPTVPQLRANVGAIWAAIGRSHEGAAWLDEVLEVEPTMSAARNWRVFADLDLGQLEDAVARSEAYLLDEDAEVAGRARAAFASWMAGDAERAARHARAVFELGGGAEVLHFRRMDSLLGAALIALGQEEEGRRLVEEAIEAIEGRVADGADGWDPLWELAAAHAALGNRERAVESLKEALNEGFPHVRWLLADPGFVGVRDHFLEAS